MLFNSYEFIFAFFPVVFIGFFLIAKHNQTAAAGWLGLASLFFYGWWSIKWLPLLVSSFCINYLFGLKLTPLTDGDERTRKITLYIALAANLAVLGFFKYANFFVGNINVVLGLFQVRQMDAPNIVLPIGISFFTFTQIAFLVDCWQGKVKEPRFINYLLFVTYFPHLIAGPVLHHSQMMPQFSKPETYRFNYDKIAIGIAIFTMGLAKKLLIADPLGEYADVVFKSVNEGNAPMFFMAWLGVLSYTFQIYFDFSGYTDMAIGLSLFFGIHLPINFNSPYKATSIIDFWRRWHISLSIFLRDYLYFPLGGNRLGKARRYINIFITMLLGGLWHGASWTYVLWGALHGVFLIINHAWRKLLGETHTYGWIGKATGWLLSFLCVCFAWVIFRAESLSVATAIYKGMLGLNGVSFPVFEGNELPYPKSAFWKILIISIIVCLAFPPAAKCAEKYVPKIKSINRFNTVQIFVSSLLTSVLLGYCISKVGRHSPFLYFQF
jgi:alginate O-acetyltransferase complex protein AlgI